MGSERSGKLTVYTRETCSGYTPEDRTFMLLFGCDGPDSAGKKCAQMPQYVVLYDMKGMVGNSDGSVEIYNVQGVPVFACSEEHAKYILATLILEPGCLGINYRTVTVKEWLGEITSK